MSQLLSESIGERRTSPRQRRLNGAKIIFNDNSSVINCVVVDLSPKGARLRVASPVGIRDCVDFRIDRNGACFTSKVATDNSVGFGRAYSARFIGCC